MRGTIDYETQQKAMYNRNHSRRRGHQANCHSHDHHHGHTRDSHNRHKPLNYGHAHSARPVSRPIYEGGEMDPNQFNVYFPEYPDFPIDSVYCCLNCLSTPNCVASFYDPDSLQCERPVRLNTTAADGPPDASCPLGTGNFPFSTPGDAIL